MKKNPFLILFTIFTIVGLISISLSQLFYNGLWADLDPCFRNSCIPWPGLNPKYDFMACFCVTPCNCNYIVMYYLGISAYILSIIFFCIYFLILIKNRMKKSISFTKFLILFSILAILHIILNYIPISNGC